MSDRYYYSYKFNPGGFTESKQENDSFTAQECRVTLSFLIQGSWRSFTQRASLVDYFVQLSTICPTMCHRLFLQLLLCKYTIVWVNPWFQSHKGIKISNHPWKTMHDLLSFQFPSSKQRSFFVCSLVLQLDKKSLFFVWPKRLTPYYLNVLWVPQVSVIVSPGSSCAGGGFSVVYVGQLYMIYITVILWEAFNEYHKSEFLAGPARNSFSVAGRE
jgi:hypothetical protein